MSSSLLIRSSALAELHEAAAWYEGRKNGLGVKLLAEVQKILDGVLVLPERYPIASGDIRSALIPRFPYCVYYRVVGDLVIVIAVCHTSRNPSVWRRRN